MGRRRRRRRGGFFRRLARSAGRVFRGVNRAIRKVAKVVTSPIRAVAKLATRGSRRRRGGGSSWGAKQGDKRGGGFVRVEGKGGINLTINPQPAEMGDKVDIDWDNTELTKDKMFQIHIHRLAGPIPETKRKK